MSAAVIIDYDFSVMNGGELLFEIAKAFLAKLDGIKLDKPLEARYLAGNDYLDGFTAFFAAVKTKKTSQKAAREFAVAVRKAFTAAMPSAVSVAFKNFVKALTDRDVKVVIATRADPAAEAVAAAFQPLQNDNVVIYHEESPCYGCVKGVTLRKTCAAIGLSQRATLAVLGSGLGVKNALRVGIDSVAVVKDHVAYQDFGGARLTLDELSGKTVKKLFPLLHV